MLVAAQTTPYSFSFQLFLSATLSAPVSYYYQLLVTVRRYYPLLCQLLLTVSATLINSHFSYYFQQQPYTISLSLGTAMT